MSKALEIVSALTEHFEKIRDQALDEKAEVRGFLAAIDKKVELAECIVKALLKQQEAIVAIQDEDALKIQQLEVKLRDFEQKELAWENERQQLLAKLEKQ